MSVSRREVLWIGATTVPASGLFLTSAAGQTPPTPGGQNFGEDPPLACALLIDGRKQIEICTWALPLAKTDGVKAFARAEVEEHEGIKAALQKIGYEYPVPPAPPAGVQPAAGAAPPRMLATGRLLLPPGMAEMVQVSREVADQCVANAKAGLRKNEQAAGPLKFDRAFVGMQLHEHYGLLDKAQVFERHATEAVNQVLRQGKPVIERHIATLEDLMAKLDEQAMKGNG